MDDPMTTATAEMFLRRAEDAEAEVERLRQVPDDLVNAAETFSTQADYTIEAMWEEQFVASLDDARAALRDAEQAGKRN